MKALILLLIFSSTVSHAAQLGPRSTMQTFLKSMVNIKNQTGDIEENYKRATETLDLSDVSEQLKDEAGKKYANELMQAIDKIKKVVYHKIPNKTDYPIWTFDKRTYDNQSLEISIIKIKDQWLFSKNTLSSLDFYKYALKQSSLASGVTGLTTSSEYFRKLMPENLTSHILFLELWQWLGLVLLFVIGVILAKSVEFFLENFLNKTIKIIKANPNEKLHKAVQPIGKIAALILIIQAIVFLDLSSNALFNVKKTLYILIDLFCIVFGHRFVSLLSFYFTQLSKKTATKFDDILIPLLAKTAFVLVYIVGAVLIFDTLDFDVTGIIAGLGIGGLAFAFAAKDMLANFFGSIMLVLDRPFDVGDVINAGGIEGVVEEVGFRSTRIRSFYDSVITISNGELMNTAIDNYGKRRYRRLVTTLGVEYDTPPEKIEAFCEGVRQLIVSHKWTRKDNFHVYFTDFNSSSLDIKVMVYWETGDYARELAERHRLMIDILRLAGTMEVNFAFPTQTLHMFKEEKSDRKNIETQTYLESGIENAKKVSQKPFSLKNPRSNSQDKEQFGDNDIGL